MIHFSFVESTYTWKSRILAPPKRGVENIFSQKVFLWKPRVLVYVGIKRAIIFWQSRSVIHKQGASHFSEGARF